MGARERTVINIRLANLAANERLFRANAGMGWTGEATRKGRFLVLENPRPFHGLPEGFPDLVGWTEIEITPDMVGTRVAVFTVEEVKTGRGRVTPAQSRFREIVERMGGVWRVIRS